MGKSGTIDEQALITLGNGSEVNGFIVVAAIAGRMESARMKHPVFAESRKAALKAVRDEFIEFSRAADHEDEELQMDEALDLIVTAIRYYNGEHNVRRNA